MRDRRAIRTVSRGLLITAMAVAALTIFAPSAQAHIDLPANGATVRGNGVTIRETVGGKDNCPFSNSGDDTRILIDGIVRFVKGDGGAYTVGWNTVNAYPNGNHTITSQGRDINGFFSCSAGSYYNISTISVNVNNRSFLSYVGATSAFHGESFTVSAALSLEAGASNVGGRTIQFCLTGGSCASGATNGSGIATASLPASVIPGSTTVTASYAGDAFFTSSSASSGFTVLKRPTTIAYAGDTSGYWNETASLAAVLRDVRANVPLENQPVTFTLGTQTVNATTDAAGLAVASLPLTENPGQFNVEATFGGTSVHVGSTNSATFDILKRPTAVVYLGDVSGYWTEDAAAIAVLMDVRSGAGVAGQAVTFTLGGSTVSATTDEDGIATAPVPLNDDPGSYVVAASFEENANYLGSLDDTAFEILKRPSTLTYTGATSGPRGSTVTLSAVLTDTRRSGTGVAGKTVHFELGSFDADATTDADGVASVDVLLNQDPNADYTVDVSFDEDGFYLASSDSESFILGWEYTFRDALDRGTVYLNTSTREFRFSAPGDTSAIKSDPSMKIIKVPADFAPPTPPCDPTVPDSCEIPPPPPPPCDTGDPASCVPDVPECVDDPAGGDPICPEDYVPGPSAAAVGDDVCIENPIDGSPICAPPVPETPEPPTLPEPPQPCEGDACTVSALCDLPGAQACSERFAIIAFSDESLTLVGFFDLKEGAFATVAVTATGPYELHSLGSFVPEPPAPPCDPAAPEGCVPETPEPPTVPPCDPTAPEGCLPETPEPPETPAPPTVPTCVEDPLGGAPVCVI